MIFLWFAKRARLGELESSAELISGVIRTFAVTEGTEGHKILDGEAFRSASHRGFFTANISHSQWSRKKTEYGARNTNIEAATAIRPSQPHPYHSPEGRLSKNMSGLIRQYISKGPSIDNLKKQDVKNITKKLNNRPRKFLGFKTPGKVFFGVNPPLALASWIRTE